MASDELKIFISSFLKNLCRFVDIEEESIGVSYNISPEYYTYLQTVIVDNETVVYIYLTAAHDTVLCTAVNEICSYIRNTYSTALDSPSDLFYNPVGHFYHTPESFADLIYKDLQEKILLRYGAAFKIDFQFITSIAEEKYETQESKGTLAFLISESDFNNTVLLFDVHEKVRIKRDNIKYIRKLFAGVGDDANALLFKRDEEGYYCFGYGCINPNNKEDMQHLSFYITIENRNTWTFYFAEKKIFRMRAGQLLCAQDRLDGCIESLKEELGSKYIVPLDPAIRAIAQQHHGTSVIFLDLTNSDFSKNVMQNLQVNDRARLIKRKHIIPRNGNTDDPTLKAIKDVARVDGALVVDFITGELVYINVIVDGKAIFKGDPASGARRNAIGCFIDNLVRDNADVKIAALIVSESGGYTVIKGSDSQKSDVK